MPVECLERPKATYRNSNLCPHCAFHGQPSLLCRLCEGLPMISRSDGINFPLLLADRPLLYPNERAAGPTRKISVCFWYSHIRHPQSTFSTIVILADSCTNHPAVFRRIEIVADLLTEELSREGSLSDFYELFDTPPAVAA